MNGVKSKNRSYLKGIVERLLCTWLMMGLLVLPAAVNSQGMPVYDNTNFVSLVQQLIESGKQTTELFKTVEFLQQQKENLELVNSVLNQLDMVSDLINQQLALQQLVQNDVAEILNSPYITPAEAQKITNAFQSIVNQAQVSVGYVQQILSSDFLKMDDGQRAMVLQAQQELSQERVAEVQAKTRRYKQVISFRKLQDKVNNREDAY